MTAPTVGYTRGMWLQLVQFLNAQFGTPGCVPEPRYPDRDGDGFGRPGPAAWVCPTVPRFTPAAAATDCDDRAADVHPGQVEQCNGIDDDCDGLVDLDDPDQDPWVCGHCESEADFDAAVIVSRTRNACVWDPSLSYCSTDPYAPDTHDAGSHLHRLKYRDDGIRLRDQLLLFLPPGFGENNEAFTDWAAFAGYPTISLGWQNDLRFEATCNDDVCFDTVHQEHQDGTDASTLCDIPPEDAVEGRLTTLLTNAAAEFPDEPWGSYLLADGTPDYERIVLAGWSGGATQASYFAGVHPFAGVLLVSGAPEVIRPLRPAPPYGAAWMSEPRATPDCAHFAMYHRDEPGAAPYDYMGMQLAELGVVGAAVDLDTNLPPYGGAHLLTTANPGDYQLAGCNEHKSMAMDGCMDESILRPVYFHWFCELPQGCAAP